MIRYGNTESAWREVKQTIESAIVSSNAKRILEVGAGANPLFPEEFLVKYGITYTALDISSDELAKAPDCYQKITADICSPNLEVDGKYDFIFSRMLAEHVSNGSAFHRNVFSLLAPGGRAFHFFPTMWAPPFVLNRLLPERFAEVILHIFQSGRESHGKLGKFPAYYSWCRGPTTSQIDRLQSVGYKVESYVGFFGHRGYYVKFPTLLKIHDKISAWLILHPNPWLTSFAHLTLQKSK